MFLFVLVVASACSSSPGSEGDVAVADGVRLEVLSTRELGRIGELFAGPEDRFAIVELRIDNDSHDPPVSTAFPLFSLRTEDGVEFLATIDTELLDASCSAMTQIAKGGGYACSVAFRVPHAQHPAALVYRPDPLLELSVELESEPCSPCGSDCVDLQTDPAHCGVCSNEIGDAQLCRDGAAVCEDSGLHACGQACVDLQADERHCGACGAAIGSDHVCENGEAACPESAPSACGSACVDLQTDVDNCGECGRSVEFCDEGEPSCVDDEALLCGTYCRDGNTNANCGACGHACVGEFSCEQHACVTTRESPEATGTCDGICGAEGLGCAGGYADYAGYSSCVEHLSDAYYSTWLSIACDEVPDPEIEEPLPYPDCTFYGTAIGMKCTCTQPD